MRNNDELTAGLDYQYTNLHESNHGGTATASTHATGHTPAMFATYTGHIADELTYEAGLRAQYDKMDVNTEDTRNRYSQWSVNPSASLTYDIDKQRGHTITLQYEHYTDQLPYGAISTFRNYLEPNHYATGNPAIKPSSGDMGQITLTLHGKFTMYARYYYDKNPIYFTNETDPDDPRLLRSMPRNGHYEQDFSIGMEQNLKPLKWWTLKATERFGLYSASTPDWKVNGQTYWIFLIDNNFKFTPTFGGGIYAYIDPKRHTDDEVWGTVWEVSCNLYKTFFDDRLTVSLYAKPYRKGRTVTVDNSLYRSMRNNMTNEEYLSLTLRFNFSSGKMKPRRAARSTQTYQKIEKTL